ncbi:MAG: TIGR02996 domain-containing protein [Deltaproteobacteria bacterium]|nr:TIGR02996 domain-containing protein [Deltaproteobacteria bacterium]MCW5806343.1 TIGR02996 domain-containing protein [Deltaproteobacteria bacterium]
MTHRELLLAAIAAAPDADGPLAVYADWLAERGEPLGELLHAQLAIAAAGGRDDPRAAELVAWERRVLRDHEAALAGRRHHPDLRWRFQRGVIVGFGHRGLFRAPPPGPEANAIWLRFFPNGRGVLRWQPLETRAQSVVGAHGAEGTYRLELVGDEVARIAVTMSFDGAGDVDYACTLRRGALDAQIHSHINGWTHATTFELVHTDAAVDSRDALSDVTGSAPSA